ncbi:MAG: hypothetical protein WBW82_22485 [Candidatus Sulfotelmatobacter sp.]
MKKQEEISRDMAIRKAMMDRASATNRARALLAQLQEWLADHEKLLITATHRTSRLSEDVRRIIDNGTVRCLTNDPSLLAAQLIQGKDLNDILLEVEREPIMQKYYASINFTGGQRDIVSDPGDLAAFKQWNRERGAVILLRTAVEIQKKTLREINVVSMQKFSKTVAQARVETARKILAALAELRRIVFDDQQLAKNLDEDEINALRPKPFPQQLLGPEAMAWLCCAVSEGIISADELTDLQPREVSAPAVATEEAEAYLQGTV